MRRPEFILIPRAHRADKNPAPQCSPRRDDRRGGLLRKLDRRESVSSADAQVQRRAVKHADNQRPME